MIKDVYDAGHRDFGENYVQELLEKAPQVNPNDLFDHQFALLLTQEFFCLLWLSPHHLFESINCKSEHCILMTSHAVVNRF
jgi:hypothetical protein